MTEETPNRSTIYIDVDDDITGIIGKLEQATDDRVAFVVPKRSSVLQSAVNMKLLQKSAQAAGKQPELITDDPALLKLAARLKLLVAAGLKDEPAVPDVMVGQAAVLPSEIIEAGEAITDSKPESPAQASPEPIAESGLEPVRADPAEKKRSIPNFDRFKKKLLLWGSGAAALVLLIWVLFFALPKATIAISGNTVDRDLSFSFTADTDAKNPNFDSEVLPATKQSLDKELSDTFTASGKKDTGKKATGTLAITN